MLMGDEIVSATKVAVSKPGHSSAVCGQSAAHVHENDIAACIAVCGALNAMIPDLRIPRAVKDLKTFRLEMVVNKMFKNQEDESENVSKEVLVIAKEINIVKSLACNDLNKRKRQLNRLKKWLELRTKSSFPFTEVDFQRIWKGLYYTMWMSDKPLVQEDLAEQLGQLLLCFKGNLNASTAFFAAFFFTMYHQWFGIDQWRIDKFMMLVRRVLRYMFRVLKDAGWSEEAIYLFNKSLKENAFTDRIGATGLTMHILDIYCEELAKVANGDINAFQVGQLVRPFVEFYCTQSDCKLTSHCRTRIFYHLLYQSSLGREYMEKYNAWKEMGFPTASLNDLEKVENGSEEADEMNDNKETAEKLHYLDPRAGKVDVYVPELPIDVTCLIDELTSFLKKEEVNTKRKKQFKKVIEIFKAFQNGKFPLGVKKMPRVKLQPKEEVISQKMENLNEVENEYYAVGRKLKQLNKRKRRKLIKSIDFQNVGEDNFDKVFEKALQQNNLKGRKRKINNKLINNSWVEEDIDEDLEPKQKKVKPDSADKNKMNEEKYTGDGISKGDENLSLETPLISAEKHYANKGKKEKCSLNENISSNDNEKTKTSNITEPAKSKTSQCTTNDQNISHNWNSPLNDGEMEYFIPSRKHKIKKANSELVLNPVSVQKNIMPTISYKSETAETTLKTPIKRVKIALKHNTEQKPSEYIRQVKSSPNVPFDASKKPTKSLLKPHSVPSPVNPFYKKILLKNTF